MPSPRRRGDRRLAREHAGSGPQLRRRAPPSAATADEVERGPHRALGVVLVRDRRAPDGHDGVADELLDRAAVALDRPRGRVEVAESSSRVLLGVARLRHAREADEVGEEHGDEPALAPALLAGSRAASAAAASERRPALAAEAHARVVRRAAGRARERAGRRTPAELLALGCSRCRRSRRSRANSERLARARHARATARPRGARRSRAPRRRAARPRPPVLARRATRRARAPSQPGRRGTDSSRNSPAAPLKRSSTRSVSPPRAPARALEPKGVHGGRASGGRRQALDELQQLLGRRRRHRARGPLSAAVTNASFMYSWLKPPSRPCLEGTIGRRATPPRPSRGEGTLGPTRSRSRLAPARPRTSPSRRTDRRCAEPSSQRAAER